MKILPPIYNEANPLVQPDYPYGRLRCERRIWIETNGKGSRFCSQTVNPKTGRVNAPHKSTYSAYMVLVEEDNGHVNPRSIGLYRGSEDLTAFLTENQDGLTAAQIQEIQEFIPIQKKFEEKMSKEIWTLPESSGPVRIV